MADELVSFCIRKGMAKFCKFFIDKKYGTIDNFLLDHNMDQFVGEPSIDPVEKALFMEKINEFVESRDNNNNKSYLATSSVKQHPVDVRCSDQPKRDNGTRLKVNQVGKFDLHEYSPNPEGRNIYEVNKSKSFDSVVDGVFYISKYRIPDTWSSAAIANFLTDGANVKSCKQFVDLIKAISGDLYPYLSEMFIYEMPRHILSGVCSIFAQKYPHLDDLYLHLKQTDPETSDKYVRAYKVFIDVSEILKDKLKNKFRNRSYRIKAQNMWPYQKSSHSSTCRGRMRAEGLKKVRGRMMKVAAELTNEPEMLTMEDGSDDKIVIEYLIQEEPVDADHQQETLDNFIQ